MSSLPSWAQGDGDVPVLSEFHSSLGCSGDVHAPYMQNRPIPLKGRELKQTSNVPQGGRPPREGTLGCGWTLSPAPWWPRVLKLTCHPQTQVPHLYKGNVAKILRLLLHRLLGGVNELTSVLYFVNCKAPSTIRLSLQSPKQNKWVLKDICQRLSGRKIQLITLLQM